MPDPEDLTEQAELFHQSMKEALAHVESVADEARKAHELAVDNQIAAKAELQRIKNEAEKIAENYIDEHRQRLEEEIRNAELLKITKKMILDGHLAPDIYRWLEIPQKMVANAWFELGYEALGDHVANVRYHDEGRAGDVIFYRDDIVLRFPYEFAMSPVLAEVGIPTEDTWVEKTGLPLSDRMPIIEFTAKRILRDQAQGYHYRIEKDSIIITM